MSRFVITLSCRLEGWGKALKRVKTIDVDSSSTLCINSPEPFLVAASSPHFHVPQGQTEHCWEPLKPRGQSSWVHSQPLPLCVKGWDKKKSCDNCCASCHCPCLPHCQGRSQAAPPSPAHQLHPCRKSAWCDLLASADEVCNVPGERKSHSTWSFLAMGRRHMPSLCEGQLCWHNVLEWGT